MFIYLHKLLLLKRKAYNVLYTKIYSKLFFSFGLKSAVCYGSTFVGMDKICIGKNTRIGRFSVITAWCDKKNASSPLIFIGNCCQIGEYVHISSINNITIGNNVLMGRRVTITDNSHGKNTSYVEFQLSPCKRNIYSKGPVIIEDNVWIGDKATILAGVKIGFGSIVGANSVVTKDVPPYSIVGGVPAKILSTLN